MMKNSEILTRGARTWAKKRKNQNQELELKFDDDKRADFLTGFHRRNVVRKNERVAHAKKMIRLERNETRAEKRRTLAELAREMERGRLGLSSEPTLSDDEHDNDGANAMDIEGEAAAATDADIIVMSSHFEGDNLTTTVVVEEMGNGMAALNNALGLARTLHQRQSANLDDSEEESEDDNPFAIQQTDDDAAPKQPAKRKRVFKYESKAERKQLRSDQLVKAKATKERKDRKAQPARVSKKKINGGRK